MAQHLDELGVPVFKALDQGLVLCKPDKVIDAEFITEVNECGIAESRVCTEQNHGVGSFRPDGLDQGAKHLEHALAAVNRAVVHADRIALDEGQQRQIAVAVVVPVEFSSFLKTMGFDGRVVHVDDEDLFAGAVAKKEVPQKFIASVEQLLRNLALKSAERGAGGQHIAHSSPKASINGKEIVIIEILVSRHQGIEALFDEILVRVKIGS